MPILRELRLEKPSAEFPFSLPLLRDFEALTFTAPITFFVGENGSGKSTLLEIIAAGLRLPALTQEETVRHPLMASALEAARSFRFVRAPAKRHGFFFRADDVTGFLQNVARNA